MRVLSGALIGGCIVLSSCTSDRREFVADVNGSKIYPEEYSVRYKSYLSEVNGRDNILMRKQILTNMINEALIRTEVERRGLDDDSLAERRLEEIRLQAVLLGYAERITLDTMAVGDEELRIEFDRYNTRVSARYVYASTEDEAWNLKDELERGATYEALARKIFEDPGLATSGGSLGTFGWGEMEPALEDAAYSLGIGELSDPVHLRMGYAIVRVDSRVKQPIVTETEFAKAKEKLTSAIEKRKVVNILALSAAKIRKELNPVFHEDILTAFAAGLGLDGRVRLNVERAEIRTSALRAEKVVDFAGGSWSVGDVLDKIRTTTDRQQKRVKSAEDLKEYIVGLAVRDVTIRRAMDQHMDRDSTVLEQIDRKRTEFLLNRWKASIQDTVGSRGWSPDSMRMRYETHKAEYAVPAEINVAEILLRTRKEANAVMAKLRKGEDFTVTAREKSIRLWAAKQGGELGFGPRAMYGPLADTLFRSPVGVPIGPFGVDPYFGIFKVKGKHEARLKSFEEAKSQIENELTAAGKIEAVKSEIGRLKKNAKIEIHENVMADIVIIQESGQK